MTDDKQSTDHNCKSSHIYLATLTSPDAQYERRDERRLQGDSMVFVHSEGRTKGMGSLEMASKESKRDRLLDESESE